MTMTDGEETKVEGETVSQDTTPGEPVVEVTTPSEAPNTEEGATEPTEG